MMDKIYVVEGEIGRYSDHEGWSICFFEQLAEAEAFAAEKQRESDAALADYLAKREARNAAEREARAAWFEANEAKMRVAYPGEAVRARLEEHAWWSDPSGREAWRKTAPPYPEGSCEHVKYSVNEVERGPQ